MLTSNYGSGKREGQRAARRVLVAKLAFADDDLSRQPMLPDTPKTSKIAVCSENQMVKTKGYQGSGAKVKQSLISAD